MESYFTLLRDKEGNTLAALLFDPVLPICALISFARMAFRSALTRAAWKRTDDAGRPGVHEDERVRALLRHSAAARRQLRDHFPRRGMREERIHGRRKPRPPTSPQPFPPQIPCSLLN